MIIACPKCETSFALPDELYKPGRKARCSSCGNVFPMPEVFHDPLPGIGTTAPPLPPEPRREPAAPARKKHTLIIAAVVLICFIGIGYGGYMIYRSFTSGAQTAVSGGQSQPPLSEEDARKRAAFEALVRGIDLGKPQQFVVDNDKLGRMVVIQGAAVNRLDKAVDFISVEAVLQDKDKQPLAVVQQVCGATLTLFQLQLLSEQELVAALNNKVVIYTYNVKVPPGGTVPFVIVFPRLPDNMAKYEVRVIDVRESTQ